MKRLLTSAALFLCTLMTFAQFSGSGAGTENDPYLILNPIQLNQMRNFLNQSGVYFKLMADIDLTDFLDDENPSQGWQPVGTSSEPFKGVLDGNGRTISGLWTKRETTSYVGLFGYTNGATLKDLYIIGNFLGEKYVAAFSGYSISTNIYNCHYDGNVQGNSYVGGCAGYITKNSQLTNCSITNGTIYASGNYVGGICGYSYSYNTITECCAYAEIKGIDYVGGICGDAYGAETIINVEYSQFMGNVEGNSYVGGIIGRMYRNSEFNFDSVSNIIACYAIGNIIANGDYVGGLIGYDLGMYSYSSKYKTGYYRKTMLSECYYCGTIVGGSQVGGLVGYKKFGDIINSYSNCSINGKKQVGGIIGYCDGGTYIKKNVSNCNRISASENYCARIIGFNGNTASGYVGGLGTSDENKSYNQTIVISQGVAQEISDDLQNGTGVSITTLKLKATYVAMGWDFNDIWAIQETECYPYMKRQTAPPVILSDVVSGDTTVSGKCIDGGIITLEIDGVKQQKYSTGHEFSFTVSPLQAGHEVRVSAKADNKEQSYYTTQTVSYLGSGTETDPYRIYTAADLTGVYRKGYFKLMNDINLTDYINQFSPTEGWESIGREGSETIHFDGDGHKITGLWCNSTRDNTGLFSFFANGNIKNLTVEAASGKQVKGGSNTGILIGKMLNGTIENCHVVGTVGDGTPVGGMVGLMDGGRIYRCEASVSITTQNANTYMGGLVGEMTGGDVDQCYTTGTLTATGATSFVGGLIGKNSAEVTNSYSEATVSSSYNAAGLIAYNYGAVEKCYATGDLFSNNYAAGIIGYNDGENAMVSGCVAMNNKIDIVYESQQTQQGGGYGQRIIGGLKNGAPAPGMDNYALKTMQVSVNDVAQKVYDDIMNGTAKTADELKKQSTYESLDWNFPSIWSMNTNTSRPYLQWSNPNRTEQSLTLNQLPTMTYGDDAYLLPVNTNQGLPITWTSSDASIATISGNVLTIKKAGSIVVSAVQEGNGDYYPFNKSFPLTINKANLRITADSYTINQGDELPELTVKYEGFKYNDDASCLTTLPTITTTATSTSAIGNYPIVVSGAKAVNYEISYVNGVLSVVDETTLNNTLFSETVEIRTGGNASISLELINEDPIIMVEFYMQLPEGVNISVDEDGYWDATLNSSRSNRHSLEVEKKNGLYHFMVFSTRNNSLKGNEGELINIKVECDENMESGSYQAALKNILLNNADKDEIILPNYNFTIYVTDVLLGDVNGDWKINGSDIVELVDHIMGRESDRFIPAAAELTGDGLINGSDLVEEISLVMSQDMSQAPSRTGNNAPRFLSSGLTLKGNSTGAAVLGVKSDESFILSQMTLQLSDGQHLIDITTDTHHSVEYRQLSKNTYSVLCYSSSNAIFSSNEALLTVHYTGQGAISVKDAMMVDNNRKEWYFSPVSLDDVTGIDWANHSLSQPADIYSINGYLVRQQASSLEGLIKGVYLINGEKVIIK